MDIAANRACGQLIFDLIRGRLAKAGFEQPALTVTKLGDFLEVIAKELWKATVEAWQPAKTKGEVLDFDNPPKWLDAVVDWNPRTQLFSKTFQMMSWLSLVAPGDKGRVVWTLHHIDGFFKTRGCRQLSGEELDTLTDQLMTYNLRPQPAHELGAASDAFYTATMRHLQGVPPGNSLRAAHRRRAFRQTVRLLCEKIESAQTMADRKATACVLGEKLEAELRASVNARREREMYFFWNEYHFFFGATQLAQ